MTAADLAREVLAHEAEYDTFGHQPDHLVTLARALLSAEAERDAALAVLRECLPRVLIRGPCRACFAHKADGHNLPCRVSAILARNPPDPDVRSQPPPPESAP